MKRILLFIILCCTSALICAQLSHRDSLQTSLVKANDEASRVNVLAQLSNSCSMEDPDSAFLYGQEGLSLAQFIGYTKGEIACKDALAL